MIGDLRDMAATTPISVLRTRDKLESATVRSHPCQKAFRYFQMTSQLRVVDASSDQQMKENAANSRTAVAALAGNGAGELGLSRKHLSKRLTALPSNTLSRASIRLWRFPSWEQSAHLASSPDESVHSSCATK